MNLKILRKIAKSSRFQLLYKRAKESNIIELFQNRTDLTKIQEWFLYYLEIYNFLYKELIEKKPYINQEVIDNDIRADAYLLMQSVDKDKLKSNKIEINPASDLPSVVFKRKI